MNLFVELFSPFGTILISRHFLDDTYDQKGKLTIKKSVLKLYVRPCTNVTGNFTFSNKYAIFEPYQIGTNTNYIFFIVGLKFEPYVDY